LRHRAPDQPLRRGDQPGPLDATTTVASRPANSSILAVGVEIRWNFGAIWRVSTCSPAVCASTTEFPPTMSVSAPIAPTTTNSGQGLAILGSVVIDGSWRRGEAYSAAPAQADRVDLVRASDVYNN